MLGALRLVLAGAVYVPEAMVQGAVPRGGAEGLTERDSRCSNCWWPATRTS